MGYDKPGRSNWKSSLIEEDLNRTFLKVAQSTPFQSSISSIWVWRILYHDHECNKTIYIQSMHLLKLPYLSVFLEIWIYEGVWCVWMKAVGLLDSSHQMGKEKSDWSTLDGDSWVEKRERVWGDFQPIQSYCLILFFFREIWLLIKRSFGEDGCLSMICIWCTLESGGGRFEAATPTES